MADNVDEVQLEVPSKSFEKQGEPLPEGKYTIVACDIDTTGKRLIDEVRRRRPFCFSPTRLLQSGFFVSQIVQIAIYSPDAEYSQYIMPLMNLNPAARNRHQIRVVTVGFFRMLKSMQTFKVVRTKTEVAALNDFLTQLEKLKEADTGSNGIILLFHEARKFVPYMVIEALKKYNLLDKFLVTVKSMVNTHPITMEKLGKTIKYFSLRQISKEVLNIDDGFNADPNNPTAFEGNASIRAKIVYKITETIARNDNENKADDSNLVPAVKTDEVQLTPEQLRDKLRVLVNSYAHSIDLEIGELKEQETNLERQSTFRPVFLQYFRTTLRHRVKAVNYRRVLAEHGYDLQTLEAVWKENHREGITAIIEKLEEINEKDRTDLIELLDHHFDPEKEPIKPQVRNYNQNRRRSRIPTRSQTRNSPRSRGGNGNNGGNSGRGNSGRGNGNNGGNSGRGNGNGGRNHNNTENSNASFQHANKENVKAAANHETLTSGEEVGPKNQKRQSRRFFRNRNTNRAPVAAN